jgi:hypothetical protein
MHPVTDAHHAIGDPRSHHLSHQTPRTK